MRKEVELICALWNLPFSVCPSRWNSLLFIILNKSESATPKLFAVYIQTHANLERK